MATLYKTRCGGGGGPESEKTQFQPCQLAASCGDTKGGGISAASKGELGAPQEHAHPQQASSSLRC